MTYTTDGAGDAFPQSIQWGPAEEAYRLLNDGNDIPADDLLGKEHLGWILRLLTASSWALRVVAEIRVQLHHYSQRWLRTKMRRT